VTELRVRAYNVLFGDAILVSVPDSDDSGGPTTKHMMVDFGNALSSEGGADEVFDAIIEDVVRQTGGAPLDLYVMTHEHLDHVQGPLFISEKLGKELTAHEVWMPGSAHPNYYDDHPEAKKKHLAMLASYEQISAFVGADAGHTTLNTILFNNNPRKTSDCVDKIRSLKVGGGDPVYVHRELPEGELHNPFSDAQLKVWAPEEDTSLYYGRFKRMALGVAGSTAGPGSVPVTPLIPPAGVDGGAFFDLVSLRRTGLVENLFTIDKASNNSSVVFSLRWKGWSLLFTGDAEERSWKEMNKRDLLGPVHFLKVSHHGSHNGTPDDELLEKVLPKVAPDGRDRHALVSTHPAAYPGSVPDDATLAEIASRVRLHRTTSVAEGDAVDILFPSSKQNS
jgi:beta-lactamase superfamily II metal-dependent hydrolase